MVNEPYFLITPFWKSKMFHTATGQPDFTPRGIIGFIRSSPLYSFHKAQYVSDAYFNGRFPEVFEKYLLQFKGNFQNMDCPIISNILDNNHTLNFLPISCQKNFIDALLGYIHAPLQTRKQREPMKCSEAQEVFNGLLDRLPLFYFVQKVLLDSPPKRVLVSICHHPRETYFFS